MPRNCLLVDDSPTTRRLARRILEANGFEVREAEDGERALAACRERLPDCVLLDWSIPVMNGLECLKALRSEFGPEAPAVVFCTTERDMGFIVQAIEQGAQEYLIKPFDAEILLGKLERVGLA